MVRIGELIREVYEKLRNERIFFLIFALLIVFSGVLFIPKNHEAYMNDTQSINQPEMVQKRNYGSPIIDINTASAEELQTLPGIGPSKARAILEYRSKSPFLKTEDITNVPGIGPKTYEKIKDRITVGNVKSTENKADKALSTITKTEANQSTGKYVTGGVDTDKISSGKIDINTADIDELQKLPGIGPTKARAILDYRKNIGKFKSVEEIKNVKGIGEKTYEKLKDLIEVK
ncbi:MAG: helix-hairpin-helix domain-containing protein [Fervidobacterium sp.]|nr:helix-hairpin-helix domain-containing protein [Fervidobacterium sp.]